MPKADFYAEFMKRVTDSAIDGMSECYEECTGNALPESVRPTIVDLLLDSYRSLREMQAGDPKLDVVQLEARWKAVGNTIMEALSHQLPGDLPYQRARLLRDEITLEVERSFVQFLEALVTFYKETLSERLEKKDDE